MMQPVADDFLASEKLSSPLSKRSVRLIQGRPIVSITGVTLAHVQILIDIGNKTYKLLQHKTTGLD